ncbi:unnamed protein product [Boreogadus saida]
MCRQIEGWSTHGFTWAARFIDFPVVAASALGPRAARRSIASRGARSSNNPPSITNEGSARVCLSVPSCSSTPQGGNTEQHAASGQKRSPPQPDQERSPPQPDQERSPPQPDQERSPPQPDQERSPPQPDQERSPPQPDQERSPPQPDQERSPPQPDQERSPPAARPGEKPPAARPGEKPPAARPGEKPPAARPGEKPPAACRRPRTRSSAFHSHKQVLSSLDIPRTRGPPRH